MIWAILVILWFLGYKVSMGWVLFWWFVASIGTSYEREL